MRYRSTARRRLSRLLPWITFTLFLLWPSVEFQDSFAAAGAKFLHDPALTNPAVNGEFSVLTYNIAGLPEIISSAKTKRAPSIAEIGRRLNRFDIVHVQEDFNYNAELYGSGNAHLYRTSTKGRIPFGDGLNTLSRYPVTQVKRVRWNDCTGADCLTPKGFTYSQIQIARDLFIDFYNIHSNAYNHPKAAAARRQNVQQLSDFINKHSAGKPVIVMGDLNGHYSYLFDNIHHLLRSNKLRDAWVTLQNNGELPQASREIPESNILNLTDDAESIDKILFRSTDQVELIPSQYALQSKLFENEKGAPLSDHLPVGLTFRWNLRQ